MVDATIRLSKQKMRSFLEAASHISPALKKSSLFNSFQVAFHGIVRTIITQRNMKIHLVAALFVSLFCMLVPLDNLSQMALLLAIVLVLFSEILNTALEAIVDLYIGEYHRLAKLAKDASAGGVLLLASFSVFVFVHVAINNVQAISNQVTRHPDLILYALSMVVLYALGLFTVRRRWLTGVWYVALLGLYFPFFVHAASELFALVGLSLLSLATVALFLSTSVNVSTKSL